jgi:hypothetical protein
MQGTEEHKVIKPFNISLTIAIVLFKLFVSQHIVIIQFY